MAPKRQAQDSLQSPSKRIKLNWSDFFKDKKNRRRPTDIINGTAATAGFITGKLGRTAPLKPNKPCVLEMESIQDGGCKILLQLCFGPNCVRRLGQLGMSFAPTDEIAISLKGIQVEAHDSISSGHRTYGTLRFGEGAVIKLLKTVGWSPVRDILNTWSDEHSILSPQDDGIWYSTPPVSLPNAPVSAPNDTVVDEEESAGPQDQGKGMSKKRRRKNESQATSFVSAPSNPTSSPHSISVPQERPSVISAPIENETVKSKKFLKRLNKQEKRMQRAAQQEAQNQAEPVFYDRQSTPVDEKPVVQTSAQESGVISAQPPCIRSPSVVSEVKSEPVSITDLENTKDPLHFACGLKVNGISYTPVEDLVKFSRRHVIALVFWCSPIKETSTKEWCSTLKIFDPSTCTFRPGNCLSDPDTHTVKCFSAKDRTWLPQPKPGDVIILRYLKSGRAGWETTSNGYKDRLQWLIFNSDTKSFGHGTVLESQQDENSDTPLLKASSLTTEIMYCSKLAEWWKNVEFQRAEDEKSVFQVGGPSNPSTASTRVSFGRPPRQFRLTKDVSVHQEPDGYYNCVVEVLHTSLDESLWQVHVTDYTSNPECRRIEAAWCHGLEDMIMTMVFWDSARDIASQMTVPGYYLMDNCKAKYSPDNQLESKVWEGKKITPLSEADANHNEHLRALLQRKEEFKRPQAHVFPELRIQDIKVDEFFTCVVRILHAKYDETRGTYAYVTDYTEHPGLLGQVVVDQLEWDGADWACNLEGRILKIKFEDAQAAKIKDMKSGDYYCIRNLRIPRRTGLGCLQGRLAGSGDLISQLSRDSDTGGLSKLKCNQLLWQAQVKKEAAGSSVKHTDSPGPSPLSKGCTSISELTKELRTVDDPLFHVRAKVRKAFPKQVKDWYHLTCDRCKKAIKRCHRACVDCDAYNERAFDYIKSGYLFTLQVEDEMGSRITVAANEQVPWLRDLEISDTEEVLKALEGRVTSLLPSAHDGPWVDMVLQADQSVAEMFWLIDFNVEDP